MPAPHRSAVVLQRGYPSFAGATRPTSTVQERQRRKACITLAAKGFGAKKEKASSATASTGDCACGSGASYQACCGKYHAGKATADTPEALLRSRFTAYKLALIDYLVDTTHPENPEYSGGPKSYARMVKGTARATEFLELKVGEQKPGSSEDEVLISFEVKYRPRAPSEQGKPALRMTETSRFVCTGGKWLFRDTDDREREAGQSMPKPQLQV